MDKLKLVRKENGVKQRKSYIVGKANGYYTIYDDAVQNKDDLNI